MAFWRAPLSTTSPSTCSKASRVTTWRGQPTRHASKSIRTTSSRDIHLVRRRCPPLPAAWRRLEVIAGSAPARYCRCTEDVPKTYGGDMGEILVVGGIKGGIGKSTLAANLAVLAARAGGDVLLIDADPQETTATWAQARADQTGELAPVTTVTIIGKQIREELKRLVGKYQTIIVDAGARDTTTQRAALSVTNLVLLPFPPRGPDLWTLEHFHADWK